MTRFDVIILGAGGAGLMCALTAAQRGRRVLIIDHNNEAGKKILVSGGGRCNFTNAHSAPDRYLSASPHFAKSALARYTPDDFIALVHKHRIAWHEKTLGQLFCDGSAKQIVAMLLAECTAPGVQIALGSSISAIEHGDNSFRVHYGAHSACAAKLVIATGGPSIPKMGASSFAYDIARQFGLRIIEPRPALVPLTLGGDEIFFRELSGVAAPVIARVDKTSFREAALFTYKGLSGPAILQVSSYWRHGQPVHINFLPDCAPDWLSGMKRLRPRAQLHTVLNMALPDRLAQILAARISSPQQLGNITDKILVGYEQQMRNWAFRPNGTEGFAKAEVTVGGIATQGLSSQTMEARAVPGLYAIGEAVDVTGWLGGYNFQWAWASGWAAGISI